MHQKKSEIHILKETNFNQNPLPPLFLPKLNPKKHPQFQIPVKNSLNLPTHQTQQFHDELNFKNPSRSKTPLFSTPNKRLILMSQNPSTLSHSTSISSLHHHHFPTSIIPAKSSFSYFPCSFSFLEPILATKTILLKLIHHPLLISTLLFLPSLYFFSSNHFPHFLFVIIFSAVILISLKFSAPFPPSIRILLAQSLSSKTPSKFHPPVVWSIGSKPKSEKRPNSGSWVQVHRNGDVYEGEFYRGKCSGSGVYYYYVSGRYEGDWVDEKYDGYGVETWAKGSRYRGQYRQGLRHGFGVYRFYTGDVYAGEWCNGQSHGCGAHTLEDGSHYVGEFKWGVKHGLGNYHFRNGDTYSGEYFADKMHGFGVYRFAHGHRYEGAWHEGRRQGFGLYTFKNGETQLGHWENGVLNVSSTANNLNGSPFSVGNSRILNAVQEATRAAEKAVNVVKVEDRVKKIVAAATRAANAARVAAVKAVQNQMHQTIPAIYNHQSFNLAKQRENDDILKN